MSNNGPVLINVTRNMTVTYTHKVTTCSGLGCFWKILLRWRGSIYKIIWADLLMFLGLYYTINVVYRFLLNDISKVYFEKVVVHCAKFGNLIPLTFVLGFYVHIVMTRWWNQYLSIPWPDNLAILISATIKSEADRARIVRRTIIRYICTCFTMTLSMISPKVKKRFPSLDHFVQAGLLLNDEKNIMESLNNEFPSYPKYWLPLTWAANIATRARHEGLIREDVSVKSILDEINRFRYKCRILLDHDWISIPLIYTQVVTLAVYFYFLTSLIGKQFINPRKHNSIDLYFPILPVLEFFFYMGWLKVAEILINPFGEDDDDFEVVWLIDRHIQVGYLIVDKIHHQHPELSKDLYWDKIVPTQLPHTVASEQFMEEQPQFSTQETYVQPIESEMKDVDGSNKRTTNSGPCSWIRRLFGGRRKKVWKLSQVSTNSHDMEENCNSQLPPSTNNLFPKPETGHGSQNHGEFEDFNRLKELRQSLIRKRLLTYFELFKKKTKKTDDEIIADLLMKQK